MFTVQMRSLHKYKLEITA